MFSSPGVLKKFKWKSGVHLIVTHANDRSISKNLIARWPKDNRNQIEKKIERKTYFSNKGERLLCILVCRKKNRTYKCILIVPGTYISIWIEETIAYSKLQDIFQRRNIILAHFGLWQEPNQICPVTQVYFVRVLTYLHLDLDWKDNRILESTTYFSIEEKSWFG